MKLLKDFGVTALFGTMVIIGVFALLFIGVSRDKIEFDQLLPIVSAWVSAIVGAYFAVKAVKTGNNQ
uniref:Uncharacterized protein n=1 Tax=viral metagenome TaxID=1070528 RepID=A0A6H2A765_9ZZZZ